MKVAKKIFILSIALFAVMCVSLFSIDYSPASAKNNNATVLTEELINDSIYFYADTYILEDDVVFDGWEDLYFKPDPEVTDQLSIDLKGHSLIFDDYVSVYIKVNTHIFDSVGGGKLTQV